MRLPLRALLLRSHHAGRFFDPLAFRVGHSQQRADGVVARRSVREEQEWKANETAARSVNVTLHIQSVPDSDDLAEVFGAITRERADAIVAIAGPMTLRNRKQIAECAIKTRLPMIAGWAEYAEAGSLISYGPNRRYAVRHLASFVDRILRGAKPADLPVERPTRLELVINLHTAKALGVTMPASLLLQADQVIE